MGACGHPGSGPRVGWKKLPRRHPRTLPRALLLGIRRDIDRWKRPGRPRERRQRGLWISDRRVWRRRRRRWKGVYQAGKSRARGSSRLTQLSGNILLPGRTELAIVLRVVGRRNQGVAGRRQTVNAARGAAIRSGILQRRRVLERAGVLQRAVALQRSSTLERTRTLKRAGRLYWTGALQRTGVLQWTTTLLRSLLSLLGVAGRTTFEPGPTGACPLHRAGSLHRTHSLLARTSGRLGGARRRLRDFGTDLRSRARGPKEDQDSCETLRPECNF